MFIFERGSRKTRNRWKQPIKLLQDSKQPRGLYVSYARLDIKPGTRHFTSIEIMKPGSRPHKFPYAGAPRVGPIRDWSTLHDLGKLLCL
jgi:hypothetical protein